MLNPYPFVLCRAGVTGLLPALPPNCSPGALGKQTKSSPEIRLKCGKGICDSHWQWKWQQVWAQQMGKHPASAPSQHREAVEQTQSRPSMWDGQGELMGLSSCASLVAVQCCMSSLCGMHAPPKAMASGSSRSHADTASGSLPPAQLAHSQFLR